jgi:hypothetical protein
MINRFNVLLVVSLCFIALLVRCTQSTPPVNNVPALVALKVNDRFTFEHWRLGPAGDTVSKWTEVHTVIAVSQTVGNRTDVVTVEVLNLEDGEKFEQQFAIDSAGDMVMPLVSGKETEWVRFSDTSKFITPEIITTGTTKGTTLSASSQAFKGRTYHIQRVQIDADVLVKIGGTSTTSNSTTIFTFSRELGYFMDGNGFSKSGGATTGTFGQRLVKVG